MALVVYRTRHKNQYTGYLQLLGFAPNPTSFLFLDEKKQKQRNPDCNRGMSKFNLFVFSML